MKSFILALGTSLLVGCGTDPKTSTPIDGTTDPSTIAEARALATGETALVEGFVSVAPSTFNSATGENGFAIQDDTGGIYIQLADAAMVSLGDKVRVEGKLTQVAQFTVLDTTATGVTVQSGTQMVVPKVVKTSEINEASEGWLVKTSGKVTQAVQDDAPYGVKVFIDDGSGEIQVFVHLIGGMPLIDTASLMMDQTIEVTGLSGQYETTYELMPRQASDLTKL